MFLSIIPIVTAMFSSTLYAQEESIVDDWDFAFRSFVIGTWWAPEPNYVEYQEYKDAGFNVVVQKRAGRSEIVDCFDTVDEHGVVNGRDCIVDVFESPENYIQGAIDLLAEYPELDLKLIIDTFIENVRDWDGQELYPETPWPDPPWPKGVHSATKEELDHLYDFVSDYVENHEPPLTENPVVGYLLGDDINFLNWTQYFESNIPPGGRTYKYVETTDYLLNKTPPVCSHGSFKGPAPL